MTTIAHAPHISDPHGGLRRRGASRWFHSMLAGTAAVVLLSTGCSVGSEQASNDAGPGDGAGTVSSSISMTDAAVPGGDTSALDVEAAELFDAGVVHTISVDFDEADYDAMIETFTSTGDKDWISAAVVIDGVEHQNVGVRLKGNSSLFGLTSATAGSPEELPWLIRLDKFVDGQNHQGYEEIVVRSNSTETAMNEAVAQELLAATGLASQRPIATALTMNGSETQLRLVVEHPDSEWYEDHFDDEDGLLYKADSEGDYSYRGDDADAYGEVFDQEVGDDDMEPLIDFLDFINNADDATFAAELTDRLDIEAFATYLAFQDLIGNADDINGRGNNSYLQYDTTTKRFTVVSWDLNLAFATANVTGAGAGAGAGQPDGGRPGGGRPGGGGPGGGGPGDQPNVLVDRFMADANFARLYESKTEDLTWLLFSSGTVDEVIATWTDVLINGAPDLVAEATVVGDAEAIIAYVDTMR